MAVELVVVDEPKREAERRLFEAFEWKVPERVQRVIGDIRAAIVVSFARCSEKEIRIFVDPCGVS